MALQYIVRIGVMSLMVFACWATSQAKNELALQSPTCLAETQAAQTLGAKGIDQSGSNFEFDRGLILKLTCVEDRLAAIEITVTPAYCEGVPILGGAKNNASQSELCYMSDEPFTKLLKRLTDVKPIGKRLTSKLLSIDGPSGTRHEVREYRHANIRILRTGAGQPEGIEGFRVVYWLPLAGMVSDKIAKNMQFADAYKYTEYFVRIGPTKVGVSKEDYRLIRRGQKVRAEFTIDGSPTRFLRINGQGRWRPTLLSLINRRG